MKHVSVVIPTRNRPALVMRAVQSVIAQTLSDIEIIVVIDGDDGITETTLQKLVDPRLRIFVLPENGGASAARNFGASVATAPWIAFLDDDDEMLPERLAIQHRVATMSQAKYPLIVCRTYMQTNSGRYIEPKFLPKKGEHVSEYILSRQSIFGHVGHIATSTLFVKKSLLSQVKFPELMRHQDWTWVLKAYTVKGCKLEFVPDPLCIYHAEHHVSGSLDSISTRNDWEWSRGWAKDHRKYMTGKAYASYMLTTTAAMAKRQADWRALPMLFKDAFARGNPSISNIVLFVGIWLSPRKAQAVMQDLRHRVRPLALLWRGRKNAVDGRAG